MGNNQALQVGAEALSGLVGGLAAALFVELPLILLGVLAMTAALLMKFEVSQESDDRSGTTVKAQ
jgi:hypothetical protein